MGHGGELIKSQPRTLGAIKHLRVPLKVNKHVLLCFVNANFVANVVSTRNILLSGYKSVGSPRDHCNKPHNITGKIFVPFSK